MRIFLKMGYAALSLYMATAFADLGWAPPAEFEQLKQKVAANGCKPVFYDKGYIPIKQYIEGMGKQCVIHDFVQRNLYSLDDGSNRGNPSVNGILIFSEAKTVNLDLGGHLISSKPFENVLGIRKNGLSLSERIPEVNLSVSNGRVETPGTWSIAVFMAPYTRHPMAGKSKSSAGEASLTIEDEPAGPLYGFDLQKKRFIRTGIWNYLPETHYVLDTLQIESGGRGVILSGAYNAVRNSTIEVDSKVAMVSYGPNLVIENNTFIIHGGEDVYTAPETQAILKLRDADNAVIRNNRFIAKGLFVSCPAAINLINSRNVQIESNTIEGCDSLVRKDGSSSTTEQGNRLK